MTRPARARGGVRAGARLAVLPALLLAGLPACGSGPGAASEIVAPGPPAALPDTLTLPDLDPPATFSATYLVVLRDRASGDVASRVCPGTLSIARQLGPRLEGNFALATTPGCGEVASGRLEGTLFRYGDVELDLQAPGLALNELPPPAGCAYAGGASRFGGAVNDKKLVALSHATLTCTGPEGAPAATDLRVRIDGARVFSGAGADLAGR